jgi:hypothetical protein
VSFEAALVNEKVRRGRALRETIAAAGHCLCMARKTNKPAPVIPEPSPRFILWSGVVAAIVLMTIVALDIANGWTG